MQSDRDPTQHRKASGVTHYFDPQPRARSERRRVRLELPDLSLDLTTDRGVFSGDRVDIGTRELLREAPSPPTTGNLLDLGCGYGPIALALAHRSPEATVYAVDVNERALALAAENAAASGLDNVVTARPSEVPPNVTFAAIYSNPPVRVGKPALHGLLLGWLARLTPGGHAYLVVQRHLGADSLARWLAEQGFVTRRMGSRKGYRIIDVTP